MKIERVSDHVYSLGIWLILPVHVWIVVEEEGLTLVDAGIPSMARGILKFLKDLGKGPLRRVVLTHGHMDHVGAAPAVAKAAGVPVLMHELEIPYAEGRLPYPRRKRAAAFLPRGLAQPLPGSAGGRLQAAGTLIPHLTPGHSPGHVAYYHEQDGVLLGGDLFTSSGGRLKRPSPPFTADMDQAVQSASILMDLKPARLEVCHGGPVFNPVDQLDAYLQRWAGASVKA